ncbi:MAG: haloacid dehalogenase, partial [Xanthobacter sp. 17-67-6]
MTEHDAHAGHHHHAPVDHPHIGTGSSPAETVKDPVCGMEVNPATAGLRSEYGGKTYFFCSAKCHDTFEAAPTAYVATEARSRPAREQPKGVIYTCPMHPQIRQVGPGNCPICGMTLEPEVTTGETGPSAELLDMTRRFWVGLVLAVPVLALEMGGHLTNLHMLLGAQASNWIQFLLATPVVLWAGWPFFTRAWQSLVTRRLNMFTLIAMGTGVAWAYSVVATFAPQIFPP